MTESSENITFFDEIQILSLSHAGESTIHVSQQLGYSVRTIEKVIPSKNCITKCRTPKTSRRFLELGDKIRVICRFQCGEGPKDIQKEFKISPRMFRRIVLQKEDCLQQAQKGSSLTIKRKLFAAYPAVDAELEKFTQFARKLRLPVTRQLMQERAKIAAQTYGVHNCKASNG